MKTILALTGTCAALVATNAQIHMDVMTLAIVGMVIVAGVVIVGFASVIKGR